MLFKLTDRDSIANKFIADLRNTAVQGDRMRFRRNLERIGEIMAYEISKGLEYGEVEVETPLGIAETTLPIQRVVLGTILRAGLPLHQGMLNVFDDADNAFVSALRKHHKDGSFEIKVQYVSCPDMDGAVLILADPMLATGASMVEALRELLLHGTPAEIHVVVAIAAQPGLDYLRRYFPDIKVWIGDLDEELTAKSYIVPGLGDAGDLAFGEKAQG